MTEAVSLAEFTYQWAPSVVTLFAAAYLIHSQITHLNERALRKKYAAACAAEFYRAAEKVLSDPATPEPLMGGMYALVTAVTRDHTGKRFVRSIIDMMEKGPPEKSSGGKMGEAIAHLRESRSDLAESIEFAFRTAFDCLFLQYGDSDPRVSVTRMKANQNRVLFRWADLVATKVQHDDEVRGHVGHKEAVAA